MHDNNGLYKGHASLDNLIKVREELIPDQACAQRNIPILELG